jgi:hypothetical protein
VGTKRPSDKMSVGTKHPWGQNVRGQNIRLGHIYQGPCLAKFCTDKNLLSVKEEKSANAHTLSLWEGGGKGCVVALLKCTIFNFFRLGYFLTIQDNVYSLSIVQCILIMS